MVVARVTPSRLHFFFAPSRENGGYNARTSQPTWGQRDSSTRRREGDRKGAKKKNKAALPLKNRTMDWSGDRNGAAGAPPSRLQSSFAPSREMASSTRAYPLPKGKIRHTKRLQYNGQGGRQLKDIEELASIAVDCGLRLHRELGPGLLESVYEAILAMQLARSGLTVARQKLLPVEFDGIALVDGFRVDLLVEGQLIIEVKSVERLAPVHSKQLLTYLRLAKQPVGLMMNFGGDTFREGLKRVVNHARDFDPRSPEFNR